MATAKPRRYTASSKAGRQIMAGTPIRKELGLSKEHQDWNAQVEAKKKAKSKS